MEYGILALTFCVSVITVCAQIPGELNYRCRTVDECREFGYICAKNRTCQCAHPIYVVNKYGDKCVGILEQKCKYDEHCIEGAYCMEQTRCKCKDNFYPDKEGLCSNLSAGNSKGPLVFPCILLYLIYYVLS